jgi:hypothetical protein
VRHKAAEYVEMVRHAISETPFCVISRNLMDDGRVPLRIGTVGGRSSPGVLRRKMATFISGEHDQHRDH